MTRGQWLTECELPRKASGAAPGNIDLAPEVYLDVVTFVIPGAVVCLEVWQ